MQVRITKSLMHYASPYYDPVKAHEYYERTKELKGRNRSLLNDDGKKVWDYTKANITAEKKYVLDQESKSNQERIEQLRTSANEAKERITKKLQELNEALTEQASAKKKTISDKRAKDLETNSEQAKAKRDEIDARTERRVKAIRAQAIPIGLTKEQRRKFLEEREKKIAQITGDASAEKDQVTKSSASDRASIQEQSRSDTDKVSKETSAEKKSNSEEANSQRKEVANQLKAALEATRSAYQQAKTSINEGYEQIYDREFSNILKEYAAGSKTAAKTTQKKDERVRVERQQYTAKVSADTVREKIDKNRK